jgi:hypothetical protein
LQHNIRIVVKDAKGFSSELNFRLQYNDNLARQIFSPNMDRLRFAPNKVNVVSRSGFEMYLPKEALYDTIVPDYYLVSSTLPATFSTAHQVGTPAIPIHRDVLVRIKLNKKIPESMQDKLLIIRTDNKEKTIRKAVWQEQWLSAAFGDFGTYQVVADTTAPTINNPGKGDTINLSSAKKLVFTPNDNFGIKKFRGTLNGAWLRFTNDKGRNWIYQFDEKCPYGVHELKVLVEDLVGNTMVKSWWIKREPYTQTPPKKKAAEKKDGKQKEKDKNSSVKKKK